MKPRKAGAGRADGAKIKGMHTELFEHYNFPYENKEVPQKIKAARVCIV